MIVLLYARVVLWLCLLTSDVLPAPHANDEPSPHRVTAYPSRTDQHGTHVSYDLLSGPSLDQPAGGDSSLRQYFRLEAFGKSYRLNVSDSRAGFVSEEHRVDYQHGESGERGPSRAVSCLHLAGSVQEETVEGLRLLEEGGGWAAVSNCRGLHGVLATADGYLYIEPVEAVPGDPHTNGHRHIIYTQPSEDRHYSGCAFDKASDQAQDDIRQDEEVRVRRSPVSTTTSSEHWVEVAMVADHTMLEYHGAHELEAYLFTLMNMVSHIYRHPSIGHAMNIVLTRTIILDTEEDAIITSPNGLNTLAGFCSWQATTPLLSPGQQDITLLVTRGSICEGFGGTCGTLGIAEFKGACNPDKRCSISEDIGLATAFTIAHELGHSLGIRHDGDMSVTCEPDNHYIMAPSFAESHNPHIWSHCSRQQLAEFLQSPESWCLSNKSAILEENVTLAVPLPATSVPLPGLDVTPTEQCQLMLGEEATHCQPGTSAVEFCSRLWCKENNQSGCSHHHIPPAAGTECTLTSGRVGVCYEGACVEFGSLVDPVEGGWGEWGEWEECSLSCGTGVQGSSRKCDSPMPANGGRYCLGASHRHQTCNSSPCPTPSDIRQELCDSEPPHSRYTEWTAPSLEYISRRGLDQCSHHCLGMPDEVLFTVMTPLPDGAPCLFTSDPDPSHSLQLSSVPESLGVCVSGECVPVGCDHSLTTLALRDACGVWCGNGSTCVPVSDTYTIPEQDSNDTGDYVYYKTVTIPRGSGRVKINEVHPTKNLYLAATTTTENFNGNYRVKEGELSSYWFAGTKWWYERPVNGIECLRADGVLKDDVTIFIISNTRNLSIEYSAGIPTDKIAAVPVVYDWWAWRWEECGGDCGEGVRERRVECVRNDTGMTMDDSFCDIESKPDTKETCHTDIECEYEWRVSPWSHCNTTCGDGERQRILQCVLVNNETMVSSGHCDSDDPSPPPVTMECHSHQGCTYQWETGNWSSCSEVCGEGERERDVACILVNNGSRVTTDKCMDPPPNTTQSWYSERGCEYVWEEGEWGQCSSECGEGTSIRLITCTLTNNHTVVSDSHCNSTLYPRSSTPCHSEEGCQFEWESGTWSQCSETCGTGTRSRNVTCLLANNATTVSHANCNITDRPATQEHCFSEGGCVYEWSTSQWSECDSGCGWGQRSRAVECLLTNNDNIVDGGYCENETSPDSMSECYSESGCSYQWWYGNWTSCSMDCGQGTRTREVACYLTNNSTRVDSHRCPSNDTPADTSDCYDESGCVYAWSSEPWSQCDTTCGRGHMTRGVSCLLTNNYTTVEDDHCSSAPRPVEERLCHDEGGCVFEWAVDDWSDCSAVCGGGERRRNITCLLTNNDTTVDDERCLGNQPEGVASCGEEACQFEWVLGEWGECVSESCEGGRRWRDVRCTLLNNQSVVDERWCGMDQMPEESSSCRVCHYEWSVGEWGGCDAWCGEGEREREVGCELVNVTGGRRRVEDDLCGQSARPEAREPCLEELCTNFVWRKSNWSKCNADCNSSGFKSRVVTCEHKNGTVMPDSPYCTSRRAKPRTERHCRVPACPDPDPCLDSPTTPCNLIVILRLCQSQHYSELCCLSCTS